MLKNKFNGVLLRKKRMEMGLSQLELANAVNDKYGASIVDVTTISRWEINPNAAPRNNKLFKVATVLGCNIEELYEDKNILKEEALTMEEWIDKLTKDNKGIYISEINNYKEEDDALTLLMKSWETFMPRNDVKDYEGREYACNIYKKLGWEQNNYDVICSSWTTYIALLVTYAQDNNIKYTKFNVNFDKVIYYYTESEHLGYWYWNKDEIGVKEATFYKYNKRKPQSSYYNKFLEDGNVHSIFAQKIAKEITGIPRLAELCHCIANFMPCPDVDGDKYNSIKGCLPDVRDYFPLMIDKIQKCVSGNTGLKYVVNGKEQEISYDVIKNWHKFFLKNRRELFLDEFYYITKKDDKDILVGIPLFRGQSLENPMPNENNLSEAKECLENILYIIQNRALKMACFLKYNDKEKIIK